MLTANILDPTHDALDPRVWDNPADSHPVLKTAHRDWIITTVYSVLHKHGYLNPDGWLDLVFTGSLTTYQYSDDSDVDISFFVNSEVFPEWSRAEMIGIMVGNVDGTKLPGTPFPMQCFVVPPEVKKETLYRPGIRSGYDLRTERWLVPPERTRVHDVKHEYNGFYAYALECADKMERLLRYEPDKAVQYWHQIHERRRRDMKSGKGDYAESNIIYKFLANRGLFPQIAETSGEYIAKTGAQVIIQKFTPNMIHPKGLGGTEVPFVYSPQHDTVFLGPNNTHHTELIRHTPELRELYGAGDEGAMAYMQGRHPEGVLLGRMGWPSRKLHFFNYGDVSPEQKSMVAQALGAPEPEEDPWKFGAAPETLNGGWTPYHLAEPAPPWRLGEWGKGYLHNDGRLYLWGAQGAGSLIHHDHAIMHAESQREQNEGVYMRAQNNPQFLIDKDGRIEWGFRAGRKYTTPEVEQQLIARVPDLRPSVDDPEQNWNFSRVAALIPPKAGLELARQKLGLTLPVRVLPTFKHHRGGYAGVSRDPHTLKDTHQIHIAPASPGARNWALWHELAHALQFERDGDFSPTSHLSDEEYWQNPKEVEAEQIAAENADIDLWQPPTIHNEYAQSIQSNHEGAHSKGVAS